MSDVDGRSSEDAEAENLQDALVSLDAIDAEVVAVRTGFRRASRVWAAVTVTTMAAALPGGILYALYRGAGYSVAGAVLSLRTRRKLRALEDRRDQVLAGDGTTDRAYTPS